MTRKELKEKIEKTSAIIRKCEEDIIRLSYAEEQREAIRNDDIETYRKYDSMEKENLETIRKLSEKHFYNNVLLKVLKENYNYLVFVDGCKVLEQICFPFDGKSYGEKTKEKIDEKMKENGFSFYFDGYLKYNYIKIGELDKNGCCYGSDYVEGYARLADNSDYSVFITDENKLVFNRVKAFPYVHFTDDPEKKAKEIIRLYRKIQEEENKLEKLHGEYNKLIPSELPHCDYFKKLNIRF